MNILLYFGKVALAALAYTVIGSAIICRLEDALGGADLCAQGKLIVIWPIMACVGVVALLRRKAIRLGVRV